MNELKLRIKGTFLSEFKCSKSYVTLFIGEIVMAVLP